VSTQALGALGGSMPADEQAVSTRVQQIQSLIQATQASSAPATGAAGNFAAALQAASAGGPPSGQFPGTASSGSSQYDPLIEEAARRYGLEPAVLHGLIQQESGFDPNATSSAGAEGLTQLMPGTAASLGVSDPMNPAQSIEGGARYLSQLMTQFGGNVSDALAAYNAGPGAVQRYGGVPPYAETESYVSKVLGYAQAYQSTAPQPSTIAGIA
jgi:soluble lytic murein transglycosylase-like protein